MRTAHHHPVDPAAWQVRGPGVVGQTTVDDRAALQVDDHATREGTYLLGTDTDPAAHTRQAHTRVWLHHPPTTQTSCSTEIRLGGQNPDEHYALQFRIHNAIRYLTLRKRHQGNDETLFDMVHHYDFGTWTDVVVCATPNRVTVQIDDVTVIDAAEFDPLLGAGLSIGTSGTAAAFSAATVRVLRDTAADAGDTRVSTGTAPRDRQVREIVQSFAADELVADVYALYAAKSGEHGITYAVALRTDAERAPQGMSGTWEGEQWLVLAGARGSRRNPTASMSTHWVAFDSLEVHDDTRFTMRARIDDVADLAVSWSLDGAHAAIDTELVSRHHGQLVLCHQGFSGRGLDGIDEVLCGPVQHAKMVRGPESLGAFELSAPIAAVQHSRPAGPVTEAVYARANELPLVHEVRTGADNQPFGMSLRDDANAVRPVLYAPQMGERAQVTDGQVLRFSLGATIQTGDLHQTYEDIVRTEYRYGAYRENVFGCSLTDTMHNLMELLASGPADEDTVAFHGSPSGWWSRAKGYADIENQHAVRSTTSGVLLGAYYLTGDEDFYQRRALPVLQFQISRNAYGWTPEPGRVVYNELGHDRICSTPLGLPSLSALHAVSRESIAMIRELALRGDGEQDYWLHRSPITSLLARYRLTGDPAVLAEARRATTSYIAEQIDTPYTELADPHSFASTYSRAWTDVLEMYEETGNEDYLWAAHREARRFITQVFVRPVPTGVVQVPDRPLYRDRQIDLAGWWEPAELYQYPDDEVADETVPAWIVSPNGLSFEALQTFRYSGFSQNPAWAPYLLRLAHHTGDQLLRDIAHNSVVGRYTNYPGYYLRQLSAHQMKPEFPYRGPFDNNTIYYHHAPAQLGMTIDYLLTEHITRSEYRINFPHAHEANYVWFAYHVYGHASGTFYGDSGVWLHMPRGLVQLDDPQINWVSGIGADRFYLSLTNSSATARTVTVRLDENLPWIEPSAEYPITVIADNGPSRSATLRNGQITVDVSRHGITALVVDGVRPTPQARHRIPVPLSDPAASYCLDDEHPGGAVRATLLPHPNDTTQHAYVQVQPTVEISAEVQNVRLAYSIDGGSTWTEVSSHVTPHEWTIRLPDLDTPFTYQVTIAGRAGPQRTLHGSR